jgi:tripartite-type tricarboxylate transporter receptor subunit TctC
MARCFALFRRSSRPMRRALIAGLAAMPALWAAPAVAQDAAMRILVSVPGGDLQDVLGRQIAEGIKGPLGRNVIVENKPGAGGRIAAAELKNAPPDGNTLFICNTAHSTIFPNLYPKLPYNPQKDFSFLAHLVTLEFALVVASNTGIKDFAGFVEFVKKDPKNTSYAVAGAGTGPHFYGEMMGRAVGVDMTHVAYRGGGPLMTDLVGGQVPAAMVAMFNAVPMHREGKVRIIATSGAKRSSLLPDVPTFKDLGHPSLEAYAWFGLCGQAAMPAAQQQAVSRAALAAIKTPESVTKMATLGLNVTALGPDEFRKIVVADDAKWGAAIRASKFKPDD